MPAAAVQLRHSLQGFGVWCFIRDSGPLQVGHDIEKPAFRDLVN